MSEGRHLFSFGVYPSKTGTGTGSGSLGFPFLNQVKDVTITTPADGQVLQFDSGTSEWVNASVNSLPDGSVTSPALNFQNMPDGGLYLKQVSPPTLSMAVDGQDSVIFRPGQVEVPTLRLQPSDNITNIVSLHWSDTASPTTGFNRTTGSGIIQTVIDGVQVSGVSASELGHSVMIVAPQFQVLDDGTVSAPAVTSANDQDTGIYFPSPNNLGIACGGVKALDLSTTQMSLGVGALALASGAGPNLAVGPGAGDSLTTGTGNIFLGNADTTAVTSNNMTVIGFGASTTGGSSVAVGANASAATTGIAVGNSCTAAQNAVCIGGQATGTNSVNIGSFGTAATTTSVSIGSAASCNSSGSSGVAVGASSEVQGNGGIAVGDTAKSAGTNTTIVGKSSGRVTLGAGNVGVGALVLDGGSTAVTECVGVGLSALSGVMTGTAQQATAVGTRALTAVTSAVGNSALGFEAGLACTTGGSNTFLGTRAGDTLTTGTLNTFVGHGSDTGTNSVTQVTAVGAATVATGASSTVVGHGSSSTGASSVCLGANSVCSGTGTIILGVQTGRSTLGANNIGIGTGVLDGGSTAVTECVGVGLNALTGAMTGTAQQATAVGTRALTAVTSAVGNSALGFEAGAGATTGGSNTFIGTTAGNTVTTGTQNTFLGHNADATVNSSIQQTCLGADSTVSASQATAVGVSSVGSGVASTAVGFQANASGLTSCCMGVSSVASAENTVAIGNGAQATAAGAYSLAPGAVANISSSYFINSGTPVPSSGVNLIFKSDGQIGPVSSSIRYKTDVREAPAPSNIDQLRVVEFKYKNDPHEKHQLGLIAEECVGKLHESLIPLDLEGDPMGISYDRLSCLLLQEIQSLRRRVALLENKPLSEPEPYVPVKEEDLYPPEKLFNETLALQKRQTIQGNIMRKANNLEKKIKESPELKDSLLNGVEAEVKALFEEREAVRAEMIRLAEEEARKFAEVVFEDEEVVKEE